MQPVWLDCTAATKSSRDLPCPRSKARITSRNPRSASAAWSEGLAHRVREAAGEPDGALILLHGRGADEHDLVPVLDVLDPERRLVGLTPGAPLPGPGGGRWWYHVPRVGFPDPATFHLAYPLLTGFLDGWLAARGIGWERTVIGGFSMGCVMSYATALGPGRPSPAGMLAISGFLPTVDGWEPELDGRAGLPVYITHGSGDPIIGVEFARDAGARLRPAGVDVEYHEHGGGHTIDPQTIGTMKTWMQARVANLKRAGNPNAR